MPDETKFDPFAPWKQFQGPMMESWSKMMSEVVATEEFAKAMGQYLNNYLEVSAPLQKQVEAAMEKYLQQMHMPSRAEVIQLAERLTHIEMRLDDMETKLDELLDAVQSHE
ncbi:MAG TPA: hypothetical protein VI451_12325 [Anaerolineales bacterium]|nr:hypothetical protein [Anaerolineales bacterium]